MMPRHCALIRVALVLKAQLAFKDSVCGILLFKHQILAAAANNDDGNTHTDEYDIEVLKEKYFL